MQLAAIAAAGVYQAVARFDASAQRTARAGDEASQVDLVDEAVEQIGAKQQLGVSLSVLQTADEMFKQLLDIKV
jgi:flagellar hook protein FlgE